MDVGASLDQAYATACAQQEQAGEELLARGISPEAAAAADAALAAGSYDPLGDGDQTPVTVLRGMAGMLACVPLRTAWATGLDGVDVVAAPEPGHRFHSACYVGHAARVREVVEATRAAACGVAEVEKAVLWDLTERRLSKMRLSALAYCCLGARNETNRREPLLRQDPEWFKWRECAEILIAAGANVNARDIAGHSVLSICGAYAANAKSIELIPLLTAAGADPNVKTRFGEPILFGAFSGQNIEGMKALLLAGANLDLEDRDGLSPRKALNSIPQLLKAVTEVDHDRAIAASKCSACRAVGARSRCLGCRSVFYCNATCQRAHWKRHKKTCADFSKTDYVDVDTETMLADSPSIGDAHNVEFVRMLTGRKGGLLEPPKKKKVDEVFVVKTQRIMKQRDPDEEKFRNTVPGGSEDDVYISSLEAAVGRLGVEAGIGPIRISNKVNDHVFLSHEGRGSEAHAKLSRLIDRGGPTGLSISKGLMLYFSAKWLVREDGELPTVLRINTKKNIPAPKPFW